MPGVPVPPGFIRPDPPHADIPPPKRSRICKLNDGKDRSYPTLADYLEIYVSHGIVRDLNDLVSNYGHLIGELFFNWVRSGQLACMFAVQLAKEPRKNRWIPIVQLNALDEGDNLGYLLNAQLDAASERNEAAAIIFPDINEPAEIVRLVNALCSDPSGRWYWTNEGLAPDPAERVGLIGLRWVLPSDETVNFVLGFAPCDSMSQTRQSPFSALFLRIRDEKRTPLHREDGRVQVHLADLDSTFHPQEVHDQVWKLTEEMRANHVEPHMNPAARARVTFSIPMEFMDRLCASKKVVVVKED